jgi:hypothetical protein
MAGQAFSSPFIRSASLILHLIETASYLQFRQFPMKLTKYARKVASDLEYLESLKVQVAVEHLDKMFSRSHQDIE